MIKNLRMRFILFNVLVISSIIIIIGLFIFVGSHSDLPVYRYVILLSITIFMVFVGSLILSKMATRPIQEAWQKQLNFTADASHELRTPITVIQTNLDLVMDNREQTVESQMKWLKNIEMENKRMAKLVGDLLTLSRADTHQQMLEKETFMLNETISETFESFEPIANEKNIKLNVNIGNKITFCGDRKRIKQLIVILLDNAINYTDSGMITVDLTQCEKKTTVIVSDTGYGIEAEHISKIFDRFYRVEKTRRINQDGLGLGLSIAKWIVQEHGGVIRVTSELKVGTSFAVHFPSN